MLLWIFLKKFSRRPVFPVLSAMIPKSWIAGRVLTLRWPFWGDAKLFCELVASCYNPTSSVMGVSVCLHPPQQFLFLFLLEPSFCMGAVLSHCASVSLATGDMEHLFLCLFDICVFSLGKKSLFKPFAHFLVGFVFCFLSIGLFIYSRD